MADAQRREDDRSYERDRRDYRDDDRRRRSSRERYARSRSPRDSRRGDDDYRRRDRERPRSRDERRYERRARSRDDDRRYERSSRGDDRRYERRSRSRGYERHERRSRSRGDERRYTRRSRSRGDERDDYYARPRSRDGYRDRTDPRAQPAVPARPKSEIEVYLASLGMDNPALPSFIASMDDELAKDFVEKLIILSKFPKDIIKDLLDTVIRKRASIKNPSAWLVVSMKKEQPCNVYSMTGFCQHGDRCRFKHVEPP